MKCIKEAMKHAKLGEIGFAGGYILSLLKEWEIPGLEYITGLAFIAGVAAGKHWERNQCQAYLLDMKEGAENGKE